MAEWSRRRQLSLFAVEGGEFDSREATISGLTILLSVCKNRKKSELYFNVGILNAKHTSGG